MGRVAVATALVNMGRIHNRSALAARRGELRREATLAERLLWGALRAHRVGLRFRRQHGVGPYVLDFYAPAGRLGIEVDGAAHDSDEAQRHDARREAYLARLGIRVIRFANDDVERDCDAVVRAILAVIEGSAAPSAR